MHGPAQTALHSNSALYSPQSDSWADAYGIIETTLVILSVIEAEPFPPTQIVCGIWLGHWPTNLITFMDAADTSDVQSVSFLGMQMKGSIRKEVVLFPFVAL